MLDDAQAVEEQPSLYGGSVRRPRPKRLAGEAQTDRTAAAAIVEPDRPPSPLGPDPSWDMTPTHALYLASDLSALELVAPRHALPDVVRSPCGPPGSCVEGRPFRRMTREIFDDVRAQLESITPASLPADKRAAALARWERIRDYAQ